MHVAPLLRVLLLALAVPTYAVHGLAAPPTPSLSPLLLICEGDGDERPLCGVDSETILVSGPDGPRAAPTSARWTLRGPLRSHAALLHGSPSYTLERDARYDDSRQRAHVTLEHRINIAPPRDTIKDLGLFRWAGTLKFTRDPFLIPWNVEPSKPGVVVAAWMHDGQVIQVQARPIPQVGPDREFVLEFDFSLQPDEAEGQPVLLLWRDGAWVAARPFSDHPATQSAWHAVMFNDPAALDQSIQAGARLGAVDFSERSTLLHYAAESGAMAVLERLVAARPKSVAEVAEDGASALARAAANGRTAAVSFLLERHAGKAARTELVSGALTHALRSGHMDCAGFLLPWLKSAAPDGIEPWIRSIPWSRGHVELARMLDLHLPPTPPATDVSRLVSSPEPNLAFALIEHTRAGRLPMLRHLLTGGTGSPNVTWRGETPLLAAAAAGSEAIVRELLAAGADPNFGAAGGHTPLMAAAQADAAGVVELLLAHGAKPNARNDEGMSALHFAAERDAVPIVSMLLDAGADLQVCTIRDITPLDLALISGANASAQILMGRGACIGLGAAYSQELILASIAHDIAEPVSTAIAQGWPATSTFSGIWPALRVAEILGAQRCARVLREAGAVSDPERPFPVVDSDSLDAPLNVTVGPQPVDPRRPDEVFPASRTRVRVLVDPQGRALFPVALDHDVTQVHQAALKTARLMRFSPPRCKGRPVATFALVEIDLPASRDRVFTASEADEPPPVMHKTRPHHPMSVKHDRSARVIVAYVINTYGRVEQVEILESSGKAYTDSARLALSQWSFRPVTHRGTPIAIRMTHSFNFDPHDD